MKGVVGYERVINVGMQHASYIPPNIALDDETNIYCQTTAVIVVPQEFLAPASTTIHHTLLGPDLGFLVFPNSK